jgi:WD40 repeat protein
VFALPADHGSVWSVAWSPDGTRLAAGSQDGTIRVALGLERTAKVLVFKAHEPRVLGSGGLHGVRTLAWSPKGDRLASGGVDRLIKLWDPLRGVELARMPEHKSWILAVSWSPDGKRLASATADRLVLLWDVETRQKLATLRGHNDFVDAVVWSPDGARLASAGIDNSVRIWDPRTGAETFALRGSSGMFHDVSWHPDGAQLAAASSDGQVWVWDATRGFERDSTARALPFIERKVAAGAARGTDRLAFAGSAYDHKRFAFATRLWADALASDPPLGHRRPSPHRYKAACAASLAAAGKGVDAAQFDDKERAHLRKQALDWLRVDLALWTEQLESGPPAARAAVQKTLKHWQQDPDLAGVRDAAALAKLPANERAAFTALWADVAALVKKAEEKAK